jgi:hypothetical protein
MGSRSLPVDGVVMSRRLLNEGDAKIREPPDCFRAPERPRVNAFTDRPASARWKPLPSKTSWFDGSSQINFLGAPSMKWPCLVAAGGGLDGGADFVGEHQPDPERAARVWAERVRRILPLPRANNLERLEH